MTNTEKLALNTLAKRLEKLASLENAMFSMDKEKDALIKEEIKPYMMWFDIVATNIKEVVELTEEKGRYKQNRLEEIIRYNL